MTTTTDAPVSAQLQPYIFFYGRCEEALAFYKHALGGTYEITYVKDTPVAEHMPTDLRDKVMHASFAAPGVAFMASDGQEAKAVDPDAGNISIALSFSDGPQGERVLGLLSDGGTVKMPLGEAFWGGRFAAIVDRFGIEWMITLP